MPRIVARLFVNGFTRQNIELHIRYRTIYRNVYDGDARELDSADLVRHIENRTYNSILYQSGLDPLVIRLPMSFTISHVLEVSPESHCISVGTADITSLIKNRIIIHPFKYYLISYDTRKYLCADDFTPDPVNVQTNFARTADVHDLVVSLDDFFTDIERRATVVTMLCNDRLSMLCNDAFIGI